MKKHGFTLAEILITMGIIGVVAALAAPALIAAVGKAKIGPTLSKAVSTFESAAELLLHDEESSALVSIAGQGHRSGEALGKALSKYMKLNNVTGSHTYFNNLTYLKYDKSNVLSAEGLHPAINYASAFVTDDDRIFYISNLNKENPYPTFANIENNQVIGEVFIDINGIHAPNTSARDLFRFILYNDGTLRPYGSKSSYDRRRNGAVNWEDSNHYCGSGTTNIIEGFTCTGSIFDNNMKVIYK